MKPEELERINCLAKKAKAEGLTEAEKEEQAVLRKAYVAMFRSNLKQQLDNTYIVDECGNKRKLEQRNLKN